VAWQLAQNRRVSLPAVMAILNVTPDSFYSGSREPTLETAMRAIEDGAAILDIGPESTRPGSEPVPAEEQIRRAVPLIKAVRQQGSKVAITIDTTSAGVAAAALDAGADAINDVSAGLDDPRMLALAAERRCGMVLMHRLAPPAKDRYSDQYAGAAPVYADVVREVRDFLRERADVAVAAGVARGGIVLDPGLGFGKSVEQNLDLIRRTQEIAALGSPVLSGVSRKSFVGRVSLGRDSTPGERLNGTLALSVMHLLAGASILRVHDVREHFEMLRAVRSFS
jgi:dihydropteroate synthase